MGMTGDQKAWEVECALAGYTHLAFSGARITLCGVTDFGIWRLWHFLTAGRVRDFRREVGELEDGYMCPKCAWYLQERLDPRSGLNSAAFLEMWGPIS